MSKQMLKALASRPTADEILDLRGQNKDEAMERVKGRLIIGRAEESRVLEIRMDPPEGEHPSIFPDVIQAVRDAKERGRLIGATPGREKDALIVSVEFW